MDIIQPASEAAAPSASGLAALLHMNACLQDLASSASSALAAVGSIKCEEVCHTAFCTILDGILPPLRAENIEALAAAASLQRTSGDATARDLVSIKSTAILQSASSAKEMLLAASVQLLNVKTLRTQYMAVHGLIHDLTQVADAVSRLLPQPAIETAPAAAAAAAAAPVQVSTGGAAAASMGPVVQVGSFDLRLLFASLKAC
jgi:hypothetical protein